MELNSQNNYQTLNDQIPIANYGPNTNGSYNQNNQWSSGYPNTSESMQPSGRQSRSQQIISQAPPTKISDLNDGSTLAKQARSGFIMKVYMILAVQLAITVGLCTISATVTEFYIFQIQNQWLFWITLPLMIIVEIFIFCSPIGRRHPFNLICLLIFTLCEAWVVSYSTSYVIYVYDDATTVVVAACMTLAIVVGLTLYAIFTKFTVKDFMIMWGIAIVVLFAMLMVGIVSLFTYSPVLTNIYCGLGVIVFGIYLVFDTKLIVGGQRMALGLDDYAIGALILYMDIIMIFIYLLQMMSRKR